jgi:hypothetical protein
LQVLVAQFRVGLLEDAIERLDHPLGRADGPIQGAAPGAGREGVGAGQDALRI